MKQTLWEFFHSRVVKSDGCWIWTGASDQKAGVRTYGQCRGERAHRASYELHVGPIPDGMWVLHHCDNPPCVNPAHLFLGTVRDNVDDMLRKGREASKIDAEKAQQIRELAAQGGLSRKAIGERFGICREAVSHILRGTAWRDRRLSSAEWQAERAEHHRATRERQLREIAALVF